MGYVDSKTINKFIRSEAWPILRKQGFTRFDSRSAFANRGKFIHVVNFQSFNSYLADGLGCTTFSFRLNLGVYVLGSPGESSRTRDKIGALAPQEYECQFRTNLRKRGPIDGFAAEDIFYIHPEGRTTARCFEEVRYLLAEKAPHWFALRNDVDQLLTQMREIEEYSTAAAPEGELDCASCGTLNWLQLKTTLLLQRHRSTPTAETAEAVLRTIDSLIGTLLDFPLLNDSNAGEELYTERIREVWDGLGIFAPVPGSSGASINEPDSLTSETWKISKETVVERHRWTSASEPMSTRKQIWPVLKSLGFSEFTERLAHRISDRAIEVIEILPVDTTERKAKALSPGLFRIGLGVFWPGIGSYGHFRMNRNSAPRPRAAECHVSNWPAPERRKSAVARTAFDSVEDAIHAIAGRGQDWLTLVKDPQSAISMLELDNWELFWRYPMMRSYGAKLSPRRLIYTAFFASLLHRQLESQQLLLQAETRLESWSPEHLRSNYRTCLEDVSNKLRDSWNQE